MFDDEGAGDDFSGLTGRPKRSAAHAYLLVAFIALIGTVTAIIVLVTASAFTDVFGSGHLFCPDGGDEIWHRPGTHVLLPELVAGLVITGGVWLGIGAILRGHDVGNAYGIGLVLASLSAGAVTFHVVASDYLSIDRGPAPAVPLRRPLPQRRPAPRLDIGTAVRRVPDRVLPVRPRITIRPGGGRRAVRPLGSRHKKSRRGDSNSRPHHYE